jgi:hypothetical protein
MLRLILPAALAAALLAPAAAGAAERIGTGYGDVRNDTNNDIQLVGGDVYLDASNRELPLRMTVVRVRIADGKRTIVLDPVPAPGRAVFGKFAAAPGRIAFALGDTADHVTDAPSLRFSSGPLTGPFTPVDGCEGVPLRNDPDALDVTRDAMLYGGNGCERTGITVRSFDGAPALHLADAGFSDAELAGRYVAYHVTGSAVRGPSVRVVDRTTGAELYAIADDGRGPGIGGLDRMHLADDGTLVVVHESPLQDNLYCGRAISWYSPAEPFAHPLPHTACGADSAFEGGRITFLKWLGGRKADLVNTDLAGGEERVLAHFDEAQQELSLDAEGDRVAWHERDCRRDSLWIARLGDAPKPSPVPGCTMRFPSHRLKVGADGRARLRVACPNGCSDVRAMVFFTADPAGPRAFTRGARAFRGKATLTLDLPSDVARRVRSGATVQGDAKVQWDPIHGGGSWAFRATLVRG